MQNEDSVHNIIIITAANSESFCRFYWHILPRKHLLFNSSLMLSRSLQVDIEHISLLNQKVETHHLPHSLV